MMPVPARSAAAFAAAGLLAGAAPAVARDWPNAGGNAQRNGRSAAAGPATPDLRWSGGRSSIIAWQPVVDAGRAFMVRQTGFPPEPASDESPVVAVDIETGAELWVRHIPFESGDWTTWVGGARDGLVYVARSGNGSSSYARLYALDAATGDTFWTSDRETGAGAYDGMVFTIDGDPVLADFRTIYRFSRHDGSTVWTAPRLCSVSGQCGPALHDGTVYVADAAVGGHVIAAFDAATGTPRYAGPVMPGFTLQNTPMAGPDGAVYLSRTQNNPSTDFFYSFTDTGSAIELNWFVEAGWTTVSEFAVGPDGTVYMMGRGNVVQRLDPADGSVLDVSAPIPADFSQPRMATDRLGRVFVSNGAFGNGRVYAVNADLTELWSAPVTNINIGGPAIADDGTLVICGIGSDVRAYFAPEPPDCYADCDGDGSVSTIDFLCFLNLFNAGSLQADCDANGALNTLDFLCYLNAFNEGC